MGVGEQELEPFEVLTVLQSIERAFGRDRGREGFHGARSLDLDLIDWQGVRLDHPDLELPHPRLQRRRFVLEPLEEVAPHFVDVRTGKSVRQLKAELEELEP